MMQSFPLGNELECLNAELSEQLYSPLVIHTTAAHKNGAIVIGDSYTKEMGLKPRDIFEIRLVYKHIRLIHLMVTKLK